MSSKPSTSETSERSKTESTGTTTRTPWAATSDYLEDIYKRAASAFQLTNNKPYTGDFISGPTAGQRSAVQQMYDIAPTLSGGASDLRSMASRIASGEFLDPSNPLLTQAIEATINPRRLDLQNTILPGVTDAAIRGGAYSGTGNTLLNTQAINDFNRNALNTGSTMQLDWFNQRFGDVFKTPGMFQAANTLSLAPSTVTGLAGETERGLNQLNLDNALAQYQHRQSAPWYGLNEFANLIYPGASNFGTTTETGRTSGTKTGTTTQAAPDMMTQFFQGGLGGLSTLASLGKAFPQTMGSLGGSIGSFLPILMGLSDRRFKEDIRQIGVSDNGIPIYRFRFIGSPTYYIGFMADDVEKVKPEAVSESTSGIKFVDYKLATEF